MANKRQLKKNIAYVCGELAAEILIAYHLSKDVERSAVEAIINDIAELQAGTIAKVTFAFDKTKKDFENAGEYNKAHAKYYAAAYAKLREEFTAKAADIVAEMNKAVPAESRKLVDSL